MIKNFKYDANRSNRKHSKVGGAGAVAQEVMCIYRLCVPPTVCTCDYTLWGHNKIHITLLSEFNSPLLNTVGLRFRNGLFRQMEREAHKSSLCHFILAKMCICSIKVRGIGKATPSHLSISVDTVAADLQHNEI